MAAAAMVLARANEADRTLTLKRIRSKSVEVSLEHRLIDQITPQDPPLTKNADSPHVRGVVMLLNYGSYDDRGCLLSGGLGVTVSSTAGLLCCLSALTALTTMMYRACCWLLPLCASGISERRHGAASVDTQGPAPVSQARSGDALPGPVHPHPHAAAGVPRGAVPSVRGGGWMGCPSGLGVLGALHVRTQESSLES